MKQKREELSGAGAGVLYEAGPPARPTHPQHLRYFGLFLKQHFSNEYTVCISGIHPPPPLRSFCLFFFVLLSLLGLTPSHHHTQAAS